MTRFLLALAAACLVAFDGVAATWDEGPPRDPFVDRSGSSSLDAISRGNVGVVLPSWGRQALYLSYRALTLGPKAVVTANEATRAALARRKAADLRNGAVEAWAKERAISLADAPGWSADGVWCPLAPGVLGEYVNCAPDAFRLALATLADLRSRGGARPQDVADWVAAQDLVFAACRAPAAGDAAATAGGGVPAVLPASAPLLLRQLRDYQIAATHLYRREHAEALAGFDAVARTRGHALRGWAAVAALRTVLRTATLDLSFERAWAATRAPGLGRAEIAARLQAARAQRNATNAKALAELRTRAAAILANRELAAIHEVTRTTLDDAQRMLDPRGWWVAATSRLARLEEHPEGDDGSLYRWADLAGEWIDAEPEPELGAARAKQPFVDWIATIQACTDNPASPHARGRCDAEHAHALDAWRKAKGKSTVWLVAALVTARRAGPEEEPLLRAASRVAEDASEAASMRYHAARILAGVQPDEARARVDRALQREPTGAERHLLRQLRVALTPKLEELGPYLARDDKGALGADGLRLVDRTFSSEDLLRLADAPSTPKALAARLYVAAWFRADLVGKAAVAESAARRVKEAVPRYASAADFYLGAEPDKRHLSLVLSAMSDPISPAVGWRRTARRSAPRAHVADPWWCTFEQTRFAAQEAAERTPPPPSLADASGAQAELEILRKYGTGSTYEAEQLLDLVRAVRLQPEEARKLLAAGANALDAEGCPNPDAARLRGALERASADLK